MERQLSSKNVATFKGGVTAVVLSEEKLCNHLAARLAGGVFGEALCSVILEAHVLRTGGLLDGMPLRSRETLRAVRLEGDVLLFGEFPVGAPFRSPETMSAVRLEGHFFLATTLPALRVCMLEGRVLLAVRLAGEVPGEALRAVMLEGRVLPARRLSGGAPPSEDTTPVPPFLMSLTRFPNRPPALGLFAKGVAPTLGLSAKGVVVLQPPCGADCREQSG